MVVMMGLVVVVLVMMGLVRVWLVVVVKAVVVVVVLALCVLVVPDVVVLLMGLTASNLVVNHFQRGLGDIGLAAHVELRGRFQHHVTPNGGSREKAQQVVLRHGLGPHR